MIEKRRKAEKIVRVLLIAGSVLWSCMLVIIPLTNSGPADSGSQAYEMMMLSRMVPGLCLTVLAIAYIALLFPIARNYRALEKKSLETVVDDITLDAPTFPKSMIYCGRRAVFRKRTCEIIPYSQIAWTYLYKEGYHGVTVEEKAAIYTVDGKKFMLPIDREEYFQLVKSCIAPASPGLILGCGPEQKKLYNDRAPGCRRSGKKVMRVLGGSFIQRTEKNSSCPWRLRKPNG